MCVCLQKIFPPPNLGLSQSVLQRKNRRQGRNRCHFRRSCDPRAPWTQGEVIFGVWVSRVLPKAPGLPLGEAETPALQASRSCTAGGLSSARFTAKGTGASLQSGILQQEAGGLLRTLPKLCRVLHNQPLQRRPGSGIFGVSVLLSCCCKAQAQRL